ncbi:ABC transporter substrate-binding protein [Gemelliphila palaticanis]|uniref:Peptide ABC transporter substrate-binding protein n=1 Tax=Gemelliphila palaticanis TaxID=81950 RepID=A0ABX2T3K2_9BACL|nr:ABC transporter substrate-binding protein [Gemella palaticanis]MBF0715885.1 peptide ABC transporter substrate-binding protein [Gemella palaticanis]NYS47815.1 peptide ABC transporter substrate-binding protein [Gemella palaticanis]
MKKSKFLKVFSSAMALSVVLAGCSAGGGSSSSSSSSASKPALEFKSMVDNGGTAVESTFKYGILSNDQLTGMWNPVFYLQATDYEVIGAMVGNTFAQDDAYRFTQGDENAPVKFELDKEAKKAKFTVHKDLKWSNGEPVTAKDIVATYELMGNKDYTENIRYEEPYELIEGMKEFHEGNADKISGIKELDERTVEIQYTELKPALVYGSGFISSFLNAKQVEEASKDFTKFAEAELNTKPLSYGPYVIDKYVEGESVLLKPNEHYYQKDKVKIKNVEMKRIPMAQASSVIKAGDVDMMGEISTEVYESSKELKNGTFLGRPAFYLSYVGFKLGKFDKEKGQVVVDPNAKAADVRVREAFGLAVDWDQINEKIYKGLRFTPTGSGFYPPVVEFLYNKENPSLKVDKEKAKKLLDEAGWKDTDNDGLRENAKGEKVTFNFGIRDVGQSFDQALAETFLKSWKEVGLDVKLVNDKLMAPKEWSQAVQSDDPNIDIFQGAWGLGTNPDPSAIIGEKSQLNLQRYIDDTLRADLAKFDSPDMFDDAKFKQTYQEFDKHFAEAKAWLPFSWKTDLIWVNSRVKNYDYIKAGKNKLSLHELELTADKPNQG